MGVNPKIMGFPPKSSILDLIGVSISKKIENRGFHLKTKNHPFWGVLPLFLKKHPCKGFPTTRGVKVLSLHFLGQSCVFCPPDRCFLKNPEVNNGVRWIP